MFFEPYLRNWDEAWYAEIIKNMVMKDYGWLMPWWNGRYYFDHPPLYFWLSGVVVKLFGLGEWQVRLVSVMAGIGVVGLTYLVGKKLFNRRAGILASLVLVSLGQVGVRFSHGNLDSLMIFFSLLTFYWWLEGKTRLSGVALGLGFLVKGWLLGMFPVAVVVSYELMHKRLPISKACCFAIKQLVMVIGVGMGIFAAWAVPAGLRFGQPMIERYVLGADAGRLSNPIENWSMKFWEYLIRDLGLWTAVGVFGLRAKKRRILMALVVVCFGFITGLNFVDEKSDWYILPAYPLLALVIGYVIRGWNKMIVVGLVIAGLVNAYRVEVMYPDKSPIGAELGRYTKNIIPRGETVVLDDHDFTAFLYYLDHEMVYVVEQQPRKANEWWRVEYDELPRFIEEKEVVWLVTPKSMIDWPGISSVKVSEYQGYSLWRMARRSG